MRVKYVIYVCFDSNINVKNRKQWLIFPPEENLKPTRIPYEESSVYSKYNFFTPNVKNLKGISTARVVTLNPGDVLFLPPKWWHYVENIDTAISINVWLPLPQDNRMRIEEAVTQMIISQFAKDLSAEEQSLIINSNQDDVLETTLSKSLTLLDKVVEIYKKENLTQKDEKPDDKETKLKIIYDTLAKNGTVQNIKKYSCSEFENLLKLKQNNSSTSTESRSEMQNKKVNILEKVINSICHPTTLSNITNNILNE